MNWHLECNSKFFINKLEAIHESRTSGCPIFFRTPDSYKTFDFHVEPTLTFEQLCRQQAQHLRDNNEEVFLFYSGGCDSHYILQTFIDNDIKIDKIIMVKSGYRSADFEIEDYALPFIRKLGISYEVRSPDQEYYEDYYLRDNLISRTQNEFWHHFRLNNHFENVGKSPKNRANIFGKEKPKLVFTQDNWYTYFLDVDVTYQLNQTNFYIDNPVLYAKQCHMLKQEIEKHKSLDDYNHITHFNENQDFWNKSIGRYNDEVFPLKFLNENGYFSNKDQLAIQSAEPRLVTAWKKRNGRIVKQFGTQWFNQGEPSLGSIGVFSEFYCLTRKDIKTVDELYPNGFKI